MKTWNLGVLGFAAFIRCAATPQPGPAFVSSMFCDPKPGTVCVVTSNADVAKGRLKGIHVFVLGRNGQVLAEVISDDQGVAYLPSTFGAEAAFVFAENGPAVSGQRWFGNDRIFLSVCGASIP